MHHTRINLRARVLPSLSAFHRYSPNPICDTIRSFSSERQKTKELRGREHRPMIRPKNRAFTAAVNHQAVLGSCSPSFAKDPCGGRWKILGERVAAHKYSYVTHVARGDDNFRDPLMSRKMDAFR